MKTNETPKKIEFFSNITTIVVNLGAILSWLFGLVSAIVLASQPGILTIPGINFQLDLLYQVTAVFSMFLAYLHYLQIYWERSKKKEKFANGFGTFVFYDLPKRRPLGLIPFLFVLILIIKIVDLAYAQNQIMVMALVFVFFVLCLGVALNFYGTRNVQAIQEFRKSLVVGLEPFSPLEISVWNLDEQLKSKWVARIKKKLDQQKSASTEDFHNDAGLDKFRDHPEINWALRMYFDRFENEQDLSLTSPLRKRGDGIFQSYYFVVLTKRPT